MKRFFMFIFVLTTLESSAGPIGCQVGPEFILVDSVMCNRFTCKNPAAMAYCYRTYRGKNRFQVANKNCTAAFCKNFSEEGREDKKSNPIETYRDRYEEIATRDHHMPPFELVKDLYELVCTEQPYNREATQELFNKIRVDHLHAIKAQKAAINAQKAAMSGSNSFLGKIRNFGLMPILGGPPTTINGSIMGNNGMGMNPMMGGGMGMNPMMGGGMGMNGGMMPMQNSKIDPCETIGMNSGNGMGNNMNQNQQYDDQEQQQYDQDQQQQW